MDYYSSQINKLVEQLSNLPGIGAKSAQRLAFHILNMPLENVKELSASILEAKENVRYCKECFTLTDQEVCPICSNPKRNKQQIMVVENTRDLAAYEKTGKYEGVYHSTVTAVQHHSNGYLLYQPIYLYLYPALS